VKKIARLSLILAVLALSACGYHLVGHGDDGGAIPADVQAISLVAVGNADAQLLTQLHQRLQSDRYVIVNVDTVDEQTQHAMLHIKVAPQTFTISAVDASGIATQYRMVFSGSVLLERQGKTIWQSGQVQRQGDVFVTGSPTSIEASRERLLRDLQKQWLLDVVGRIRSGF